MCVEKRIVRTASILYNYVNNPMLNDIEVTDGTLDQGQNNART